MKLLIAIGIKISSFLWFCSFLYSADFPFDLKQQVGSPKENWVFSPISISSCLAMVADGAAGSTREEIGSVLGNFRLVNSSADEHCEVHLAQKLWVREGMPILPFYQQLLWTTYQASIENIRFLPEAAFEINSWIEQQTNHKITDLLSPLDISPMTHMILINAFYFRGSWVYPFSEKNTSLNLFYTTPESSTSTQFMEQTQSFSFFENERYKAVVLPCTFSTNNGGSRPICLLILPHQFGEDSLDRCCVNEVLQSAKIKTVTVRIPKFKLEHHLELSEPLRQLGMNAVFTPFADLSGISGKSGLYLSDVLHKTFFSFDEIGIEAAAASSAIINKTSFQREPKVDFIANRPFYFALIDSKTETIFFIGHIQSPCI